MRGWRFKPTSALVRTYDGLGYKRVSVINVRFCSRVARYGSAFMAICDDNLTRDTLINDSPCNEELLKKIRHLRVQQEKLDKEETKLHKQLDVITAYDMLKEQKP